MPLSPLYDAQFHISIIIWDAGQLHHRVACIFGHIICQTSYTFSSNKKFKLPKHKKIPVIKMPR